jgi:hypothetical protein
MRSFATKMFLLAAIVIGATSATTIMMKADFKGEWAFNEQKSKLAEGRFRMNASKIKVSPDGDGLAIERTTASPNGESATTTDKVALDGKQTEGTAFGDSKKKMTAAWSADGETLTINSTILFERDGNSMEFKTVENWKLLDGGKTLSIETTTTSQRGTTANTFVYDKK